MNLPSDRSLTDWVAPSNTSALCDAIPVLWQNTDIQILSLLGEQITQSASTATISNTQSTSPPTATGSLGVISYNSSLTPSASSFLSIGAKAAIGIIIPSAFLALIVGILLFFRRRNSRNQQAHHELSTSSSIDSSNWTQLSSLQKQGLKGKTSELDSLTRFEADADHQIAELGGGHGNRDEVHELPGSLVQFKGDV
jgi:hypothetical protein